MDDARTRLRGTAASALSLGAKALTLGAHLLEGLSGLLRPSEEERAAADEAAPQTTDDATGPVRVPVEAAPPPAPAAPAAPADRPHARTHDTHIHELAERPAAEVIRAVEHLSTDELERLYAHERASRARKPVLAAIERSFAPEQSAPSPE